MYNADILYRYEHTHPGLLEQPCRDKFRECKSQNYNYILSIDCTSTLNRNHYITYPSQWRRKTVANHSCIIVCTDIVNSLNKTAPLQICTLLRKKKKETFRCLPVISTSVYVLDLFLRAANFERG